MAQPPKPQIIIAFAALYLIWGSTYLGIFFAIQSIPPFLMARARFFLAGLLLFALARTQGPRRSTWAEWRPSIIVAVCWRSSANVVRRRPAHVVRPISRWTETISSGDYYFVVVRRVCLSRTRRRARRLHRLLLAAPPLRSGKSRDLCLRESDRRRV